MTDVTRPVVLIAEELSPATVEALGPDFEIRQINGADRAELIPAIADVDAILIRSATKVDAEALAAAKKLKVVARAGVGLDNVDVKAATQAGVMVVNAPTSNIVSAAELAVALLLAAARRVPAADLSLKNGDWKRSKFSGVELFEKTVGIVGLGKIGVLVAQRLAAFGMNVIAYDPYVQAGRAAQMGVRLASLDDDEVLAGEMRNESVLLVPNDSRHGNQVDRRLELRRLILWRLRRTLLRRYPASPDTRPKPQHR